MRQLWSFDLCFPPGTVDEFSTADVFDVAAAYGFVHTWFGSVNAWARSFDETPVVRVMAANGMHEDEFPDLDSAWLKMRARGGGLSLWNGDELEIFVSLQRLDDQELVGARQVSGEESLFDKLHISAAVADIMGGGEIRRLFEAGVLELCERLRPAFAWGSTEDQWETLMPMPIHGHVQRDEPILHLPFTIAPADSRIGRALVDKCRTQGGSCQIKGGYVSHWDGEPFWFGHWYT